MSSNLHRNSTEANKHTPKGFDLADNNSTLLRDERGQSRYIDNLVNERVENLVDGFNAPPTTTSGHLYVLIDEGSGTVNTDWNGANYNDIVRIQDGVWVNITPVNGYLVFNKTDEKYYKFGSSGWVEFIPESENIYTNDGTIGSNRVATLTDTLSFSGGRVSFDTTTNGVLLPRLTTVQMNGISSPATNLLVYNTDLNGLYRYNGSSWVALSSGYGIIGVYSGSGNGTPTFFADLQSALETCKASGEYFTVKLYSNITITSAIQIEYTGSGVGNAYQFRQLTIDFNGFSVTNAQADTSEGFDVRLSNNVAVYQEIRFINGGIIRTNGTGTHRALKIDLSGRIGILRMSKMFVYCQNSNACNLRLANGHTNGLDKVHDLGGSVFVSGTATALNLSDVAQNVQNFKAISYGSVATVNITRGIASNFFAENLGTGNAVSGLSAEIITVNNFFAKSNSGKAVACSLTKFNNFTALSTSGIAVEVDNGGSVDNFIAITGNNKALRILSASSAYNGKCYNNSANQCVEASNISSSENVSGINSGSGAGFTIFTNQVAQNNEFSKITGVSVGGVGGSITSSVSALVKVTKSDFISRWDNSGGHGLVVSTASGGVIQLTLTELKVKNSGANAINATSAVTVNSRYCTHNEVATTPINANVTIVSSGIIS